MVARTDAEAETKLDDYVDSGGSFAESMDEPWASLRDRPTPPSSSEDSLSETCLSFTISGPWAHFRRLEGNVVKQTYRIMPRTTVAGMMAAILGYDRDSYYQLFDHDAAAIAVEPTSELQVMNLPQNMLATAASDDDFETIGSSSGLSIKVPRPDRPRKQHNYEVLTDASYRIDVRLANDDAYDTLRTLLENQWAVYPPSLGLSEFLGRVEYHGEFEVEQLDRGVHEVESAVPNADDRILPPVEGEYRVERSPGAMELTDKEGEFTHRRTTDYVTNAYRPDAGSLEMRKAAPSMVDGRVIMFS